MIGDYLEIVYEEAPEVLHFALQHNFRPYRFYTFLKHLRRHAPEVPIKALIYDGFSRDSIRKYCRALALMGIVRIERKHSAMYIRILRDPLSLNQSQPIDSRVGTGRRTTDQAKIPAKA